MKNKLQTLSALVIIVLVLGGALAVAKALLGWFSSLDQTTRTATIGAIAVISVPLLTYFASKSIERKRAVEQAMRLEKVRIYQSFTVFFMRLLLKSHPAGKPDEKEILVFLATITPEFITYGSNDVVKKWGKFSRMLREESDKIESNPARYMFEFESLLKSLRSDLGHNSFTISKGDIARLFINDIDEYLNKPSSNTSK